MRYLILVGHDDEGGKKLSPEEHGALYMAFKKYQADLTQAGVLLGGEALQGTDKATRLSLDDGKRQVLDGPFSESKEIIGGFFLIDAKSDQEAREWAARCPAANLGPWSYVELRPIQVIPT